MTDHRYDEDEARAILRRAGELESREGMSRKELLAAAGEAGFSSEAVERALEERSTDPQSAPASFEGERDPTAIAAALSRICGETAVEVSPPPVREVRARLYSVLTITDVVVTSSGGRTSVRFTRHKELLALPVLILLAVSLLAVGFHPWQSIAAVAIALGAYGHPQLPRKPGCGAPAKRDPRGDRFSSTHRQELNRGSACPRRLLRFSRHELVAGSPRCKVGSLQCRTTGRPLEVAVRKRPTMPDGYALRATDRARMLTLRLKDEDGARVLDLR
jgi:plasmid stability protein